MIRTICLAAALLAAACTRPTDDLGHRLDEALKGRCARIGVAVRTPDGRTIRRGDVPLPLLSVFKVPVALAALDRAARERMPLSAPPRRTFTSGSTAASSVTARTASWRRSST